MGGKSWTTEDQLVWLKAKVPEYLKKHAEGALDTFYAPTYQAFLDKWPASEAGKTEKRKKVSSTCLATNHINTYYVQQIRWWFINHTRPVTSTGKKAAKGTELLETKKYTMQAYQAYMKLYTKQVNKIADERYGQLAEPKPDKFAFTCTVARELLKDESEE